MRKLDRIGKNWEEIITEILFNQNILLYSNFSLKQEQKVDYKLVNENLILEKRSFYELFTSKL